MPGTLAVMLAKRFSLPRRSSLARASSAVRSRTRASRVSCVRRRSVMSRTRASTSFCPSLRKTATRRLGRERRPILSAHDALQRDGHAGHHVFPAVGGFLALGIGVDVTRGHRQQRRTRVTQAVARFLVHVDEPAGEIVNEDRFARLLDEVTKTPLALAQGGFDFLTLGGVARESRHARGSAGGRVAQEEQVPVDRNGRAGLKIAKTRIPHPAPRPHERRDHRAEEERTILADEVVDDAGAAGIFQPIETDKTAARLVEVVNFAVEAGERDEIRAFLDELFEPVAGKFAVVTAFEFGAQAFIEAGQFANAGFERGGSAIGNLGKIPVDGGQVGGAAWAGKMSRQADGRGPRRRCGCQWGQQGGAANRRGGRAGRARCADRGRGLIGETDEFAQETAVLGTQLARAGIEQAKASGGPGIPVRGARRTVEKNGGKETQTRLNIVGDDRRTEPGEARIVVEIGHHEEFLSRRVEQIAVIQRLGDQRIGGKIRGVVPPVEAWKFASLQDRA